MTEKEVGELYTRLAFQYESSIDSLLEKNYNAKPLPKSLYMLYPQTIILSILLLE